MKKRITSLALVFAIVLSMLVTAIPAYAAGENELVATPNKTTAHPGDTITYTVSIGPIKKLNVIQFDLEIPAGLTYVKESGKLVDDFVTTFSAVMADFTETEDPKPKGTKRFTCFREGAYTSTKDTDLMTFDCTVDPSATGDIVVGITGLTFTDDAYEKIVVSYTESSSKITVSPAVAVTGVTVDPTEKTLTTAGETFTLAPTLAPNNATNKNVTFSSDNTAVATVDPASGKVTAVANGIAKITATTEDGSKTATCTVTVDILPTTIAVTGVTVAPTEKTLTAKGATFKLEPTVAPKDATNKKVTFSSNNTAVATVDPAAGKVTAVANGTAIITATTVDGSKTATCKVTVNITTTPPSNPGGTVTTPSKPGSSTQTPSTSTPVNYEITTGKNAVWQLSGKEDLVIASTAPFEKFTEVKLGGVTLGKENYSVKSGSTVVTVKSSYLNTLKAGKYDFVIVSSDGTAATQITLSAATAVPKTADSGNMLPYMLLAVLFAALGLAVRQGKKSLR